MDGDNFFTTLDGERLATPLLLCLVCVELSDIIFAFDRCWRGPLYPFLPRLHKQSEALALTLRSPPPPSTSPPLPLLPPPPPHLWTASLQSLA
jgi:hypothetical protein